jgi:hypothetical protein
MLISRLGLFCAIQAIFAFGFWLVGSPAPWENSSNWWPFLAILTNFISIALLIWLFKQTDQRYWDIFRIRKENILRDILLVLGLFVIGGPLGCLPNPYLSKALFGDE